MTHFSTANLNRPPNPACANRLSLRPRVGLAPALIVIAIAGSAARLAFAQSTGQGSPRWVLQSRVQLTLSGDPRFKDVSATVTTPGTVVLEGNVFNRKAKDAADQAVRAVEGVNRVINALTTTSFDWKLTQNRINQGLLAAGVIGVTATVIGNQVFLDGVVHSDAAKQQALNVVQSAAPNLAIGSNIIRVVPNGLF